MIKLTYDNAAQASDIVRSDAGIELDDTLETAVYISLFTRRRALPDDVVPDGGKDRCGWWADAYPEAEGYLMGSRLWLLGRNKATKDTLAEAKSYALEALQWLVDDGIAESVDVVVERQRGDALVFQVQVTKPTEPASRWTGIWTAHAALL